MAVWLWRIFVIVIGQLIMHCTWQIKLILSFLMLNVECNNNNKKKQSPELLIFKFMFCYVVFLLSFFNAVYLCTIYYLCTFALLVD